MKERFGKFFGKLELFTLKFPESKQDSNGGGWGEQVER